MSQEKFQTALGEISKQFWDENKQPILLSSLPSEINKKLKDFDYKSVLNGKSFKSFILETQESADYRLVEHPTIKAKVSLLPSGATYDFQDPPVKQLAKLSPERKGMDKNAPSPAIALLNILATLSEEDIEKINIPVSVIVKLLK